MSCWFELRRDSNKVDFVQIRIQITRTRDSRKLQDQSVSHRELDEFRGNRQRFRKTGDKSYRSTCWI
jgi:hypothetical protein